MVAIKSAAAAVMLVAGITAATARTDGNQFATNAEFLAACQAGGDGRRLCLDYMHEAVRFTLSLAKESGWPANTFCPPPLNDAKLIEIIVHYLKTDPQTAFLTPDAAAQIALLSASKCPYKSR